MKIRDRIKELRRVPANDLRPNPKNWRTHPPAQRDALRGLLAEIGYAGALLARELPDGSLQLIDGHLRAETTPDEFVPVLVLDVTEAESDKILATHDPLAAMAARDLPQLTSLLEQVRSDSPAVRQLLDSLTGEQSASDNSTSQHPPRPVKIPSLFQVLVACASEQQQQQIYEQLTEQGFACRVLTL